MVAKGSRTLQIYRPGEPDRYGDEGPEVLVAVCRQAILWPRYSRDDDGGRGIVTIEGRSAFVPTGLTEWEPDVPEPEQHLRPTDMVYTEDGQRWELEGAVGDWEKKSGKKVGFMFELKRRAG